MKNDRLQLLARNYLDRLTYMAEKHGIGAWIRELKAENRRGECEATKKEVDMLARLVDDDRLNKHEIPSFVGKPYVRCQKDGVFKKIRKFGKRGTYSKVDAYLIGNAELKQ